MKSLDQLSRKSQGYQIVASVHSNPCLIPTTPGSQRPFHTPHQLTCQPGRANLAGVPYAHQSFYKLGGRKVLGTCYSNISRT